MIRIANPRLEPTRLRAGAGIVAALAALAASPALAAPKAAPGAATPAITRSLERGPDRRVALVGGLLSAPSRARPEAVAMAFLATRPAVLGGVDPATLRLDAAIALGRGHILRYRQMHRDLPVIGGTTVVRVDETGRVRWAGSEARPIPATIATTPVLDARQALAAVGRAARHEPAYTAALDPKQTTRLALYTQPGMTTPRLVWWIELPFEPARMRTLRAIVDAATGYVYRLDNRVVSAGACPAGSLRAHVYEHNPVATPEPSCVSLADYLPAGATQLGNDDITTGNCIDRNGCRTVDLGVALDIHWCDDDPEARTNGAGDFTDYVFESHTADSDAFAEVQMFYHVTKAYDVARALGGFTDLVAKPLGAVVNFRAPVNFASDDILGDLLAQTCSGGAYSGGKPLYAFDNAFFAPAGGFLGYPERDSIVFGQGSAADFAYDGDVIYHEFGHALMSTVAPDLGFGFIDQHGFNPTPAGMHEGFADLMTMFVTDDPVIGEYVGQGLGIGAVRVIDNATACPDDLIGEGHIDSLLITGAVWQARKTVADTEDKKRAFDQALFAAQQTLTASDDYTTAAAKIVLELDTSMGTDIASAVQDIFADRGLDGCDQRVVDGAAGRQLMIVGSSGQTEPAGKVPAPVQHRYELGGGADAITVAFAGSQPLSVGVPGTQSTVEVVLKRDESIRWSVEGGALSGDYALTAPVTIDSAGAGTATLTGPFEPGTYYLQLTAEGTSLVLWELAIGHQGGSGAPDAGPGPGPDAGTDGDAGTEPGPDAGPGGGHDDHGDGGCGCAAAGSPRRQAGALVLALLCLGWLAAPRRSRRIASDRV